MFKRMLSLLLCFVLVAGMVPAGAFAAEAEETLPVVDLPQEELRLEESQETAPEETRETLPEETQETIGQEDLPREVAHQLVVPDFWNYDLEAAFEGYARQQFYPSKMSLQGTAAGETLTGAPKAIYDVLAKAMGDIAAGRRSSAIITMGVEVYGEVPEYPAQIDVFPSREEFQSVMLALRLDLNYELYWFDFTVGYSYGGYEGSDGCFVEMMFAMTPPFSDGGYYEFSNGYRMLVSADREKTGATSAAVANAKKIVADNGGKSDYKKLESYAQWLADNTDYDYDAVNNNSFQEDNGPWQMIYAFDGDTDTKIVCEGYSKAFQYLCDLTSFRGDVECYKVIGAMDGGGHMWNHVRIGTKTYLVDVTVYDQSWGYWTQAFMAGGPVNADGTYTFYNTVYSFDQEAWDMWEKEGILILAEAPYDPSAECPGHVWDAGVVVTEPTCSTKGTIRYSCTICSETKEEKIPTIDHDHTPYEEVEPTCARPGSTGGSYCSMCGLVHEAATVLPALGHDTVMRNQKEATCEENGYTGDEFCTRCNACTAFGHSIPALGHQEELVGAAQADCEKDGYTGDRVCTRCEKLLEQGEELPALGHETIQVGAREPDCENPGHSGREECSRCGKALTEGESIPALGHDPVRTGETQPDCEKPGYTGDLICQRCGKTTETGETIPALGHEPELTGRAEPDCVSDGYTGDLICLTCGQTLEQGQAVPALGHDSQTIGAYDAQCETPGYTGDQVCQRCGETTRQGQEIPALGHDTVVQDALEPDCLHGGYSGDLLCTRCGVITEYGEALDPLGHESTWVDAVEPDCENPGHTGAEVCGRCGEPLGDGEVLPALGHSPAQALFPAREATDTEYGNEEFEILACLRCGVYVHADGTPMTDGEIEALRLQHKTYAEAREVRITLAEGGQIPEIINKSLYPEGLALKAQVLPATAKQEVIWSSGAKATATVEEGLVTLLKNGSVTITARAENGEKGTAKLDIRTLAGTVTVTAGQNHLIPGKSLTLKAQVLPADVSNRKVVWSTSHEELVTISTSGVLKIRSGADLTGAPIEILVTATAADGSGICGSWPVTLYPKTTRVTITLAGEEATGTLILPVGGEPLELGCLLAPANARDAVTWKSSSTKTAQVNAQGQVIGLKPGTVTITATAADGSGRKDTIKIKVVQLMESLELPGEKILAGGKSFTFKAVIGPANTTTKTLRWYLVGDVPAGFAISKSGQLKTAAVTEPVFFAVVAEATDGSGAQAVCEVAVYPAAKKVELTDADGQPITEKTLELPMGQTLQLGAAVTPEQAHDAVTWKTSSAKTAQVDETGLVTPLKPGTVTLTVTAADGSGKKDTVKIKVVQLMERLTIPGTKDLALGKSFTFKAQVEPANTTNKGVSWSLETPADGVSISSGGVLKVSKTARAESVTVVATAKDGSGVTARCIVSIWPPVTKVTIVEPNAPIVLEVGECLDLEAITTPWEACPNVTWKSSAAKTATVDENGMVIALKTGTVTITATAADGSGKKDTVKIRIVSG